MQSHESEVRKLLLMTQTRNPKYVISELYKSNRKRPIFPTMRKHVKLNQPFCDFGNTVGWNIFQRN